MMVFPFRNYMIICPFCSVGCLLYIRCLFPADNLLQFIKPSWETSMVHTDLSTDYWMLVYLPCISKFLRRKVFSDLFVVKSENAGT